MSKDLYASHPILRILRAGACKGPCEVNVCACAVYDEAAEEIERLLTALYAIKDAPDDKMRQIALDALD